jgi:hypothetical protein
MLLGSYLTDAFTEIFASLKKYPNILLTTYDREPMPEK